jgi:hypothetical protein
LSAHDIIHKLATDARRLRLGKRLPDGATPWELVQRVRADFLFLLEQGVTLEDVAHAMGDGYSRGTLSRFCNLIEPTDYASDLDRIVRGVNQFLETIARRQEAPKPEGWVETSGARHMLLVIAKAIELQAIGLIYSDAGLGKTLTLQAAAIHPGGRAGARAPVEPLGQRPGQIPCPPAAAPRLRDHGEGSAEAHRDASRVGPGHPDR